MVQAKSWGSWPGEDNWICYIYIFHTQHIYTDILSDSTWCLLSTALLIPVFFWQFFSADRIKVSIHGFFWKDWSMDLERQQPWWCLGLSLPCPPICQEDLRNRINTDHLSKQIPGPSKRCQMVATRVSIYHPLGFNWRPGRCRCVGRQISAASCAFAALTSFGNVVTWGHPERGGDSRHVQDQLKLDSDSGWCYKYLSFGLRCRGPLSTQEGIG